MSRFLVVGAGLTGATLARLLSDDGRDVTIIDKRDKIAGNCRTENRDGIDIHVYGAHIFHTSNENVWRFVNRFADFNRFINSPIAVTKEEEFYNLPFNMNTFSKMFNTRWPSEVEEIIKTEKEEYIKDHPNIENLEDQAINMVGTTIYNKLVKEYTEKQWNKKCSELDPSIIKRLPLRMTYDNNYFNDKYQGIPKEGYTDMIDNMIYDIPVILETDFNDLKLEFERDYDYIIYTGKIDEYFNYSLGKLDYRSLKFITKELPTTNYQGNAVVNFTGNNVDYTRIIEHRHFNYTDNNYSTYITYEYPQSEGEPFYPMSDKRNLDLYNKYKKLAETKPNIIFAGRLGKYKYFDMDDVIKDCFDIYTNIKK